MLSPSPCWAAAEAGKPNREATETEPRAEQAWRIAGRRGDDPPRGRAVALADRAQSAPAVHVELLT